MNKNFDLTPKEQGVYDLLIKLINRVCSSSDAQLLIEGIDLLIDLIRLDWNRGFSMSVDEYREMMRTGKMPDRFYQDDK